MNSRAHICSGPLIPLGISVTRLAGVRAYLKL